MTENLTCQYVQLLCYFTLTVIKGAGHATARASSQGCVRRIRHGLEKDIKING